MSNHELGRYVRNARLAAGLTQQEVAAASRGRIGRSWIAAIESGARERPEPDRLEVLAQVLKIRAEELFARAGYVSRPTRKQPTGERAPLELLRELEASLRQQPIAVPIVRGGLSAGGGAPVETEYLPYYPRQGERGHLYRAYEVVGHCLEPRIMNGHLAIVDTSVEPRSGDVVALAHNGYAKVKLWTEKGGAIYLTALQGEPDMLLTDEVQIIGVVKAVQYRP